MNTLQENVRQSERRIYCEILGLLIAKVKKNEFFNVLGYKLERFVGSLFEPASKLFVWESH